MSVRRHTFDFDHRAATTCVGFRLPLRCGVQRTKLVPLTNRVILNGTPYEQMPNSVELQDREKFVAYCVLDVEAGSFAGDDEVALADGDAAEEAASFVGAAAVDETVSFAGAEGAAGLDNAATADDAEATSFAGADAIGDAATWVDAASVGDADLMALEGADEGSAFSVAADATLGDATAAEDALAVAPVTTLP